jgi:hypothetical protein
MRNILALSLLVILCGTANAATASHSNRRHARNPALGLAYAPPRPPIHYQPAPYYNSQPSAYDNRYPNWVGNA